MIKRQMYGRAAFSLLRKRVPFAHDQPVPSRLIEEKNVARLNKDVVHFAHEPVSRCVHR